jgi:hypothetical protein
LRPFLSLIDLSCKPEGAENVTAVAVLEKWEPRIVAGFPNFVEKSFVDFSMK